MEAFANSKDKKAEISIAIPTLVHTRGGPLARARIAVRVSAPANQLGFENSALHDGWVTVEAAEELPHSLSDQARHDAQTRAQNIAIQGVNSALEALLLSVAEVREEDKAVLLAVVQRPQVFLDAGFAEPLIRLIQASPRASWAALTRDEQEELRQCLL